MSSHLILCRTAVAAEVASDGRTLEGVALRFDAPEWVSDPGSAPYREAFSVRAFTKTLQERAAGKFPLGVLHPWAPSARTSPIPVGAVEFRIDADALSYTARVSDTVAGNEALELVRDGAMRDVSIGFYALATRDLRDADGPYRLRTEVKLIELSLVPTGLAARSDAKVLALRSDLSPSTTRKRSTLLLPPEAL